MSKYAGPAGASVGGIGGGGDEDCAPGLVRESGFASSRVATGNVEFFVIVVDEGVRTF